MRGLDWRFVFATVGRLAVVGWFVAYSAWLVRGALDLRIVGGDAAIYAAAARAWLAGGDPWATSIQWGPYGDPVLFAAPPSSLLFSAPFAFMPEAVVRATWVSLDAIVLVLVVRRLRLAWWWCLFPPAVSATTVGNAEPVVLGLLVLGGGRLAALAPLLKPYAVMPLLADRRWRDLAIAACLLGASVLILPWGRFIADLDLVRESLIRQTAGGLSALSVPWLIPLGLVGLAALGWRRGLWLAVPVLWPLSQLHYATVTMPVLSLVTGFGFSLPIPGAAAVAVFARALADRLPRLAWRWASGHSERRDEIEPQPAGEDGETATV